MKKVYIIMGVSGCGKSTIGQALSDRLKIPFYDGDDFHPEANIQKMSSGQPLNDDDRQPWLESINHHAVHHDQSLIVACSALKANYRKIISHKLDGLVHFIHLHGEQSLILDRMRSRNHFMPESLLASQFDTLEWPDDAINIPIDQSIGNIINKILQSVNAADLSEIGLVGLGVMGANLARNIARNGYTIALYNRHIPGKEEHVAEGAIQQYDELSESKGFDDLKLFVANLQRPRKIILMITAGRAVDAFINEIEPFLVSGDILVDGGNSFYEDTLRRINYLSNKKIHWVGAGVSGGSEGALLGPSIMPGGEKASLESILPILKDISAKGKNNQPCCDRVGSGASGHFVKMVHNGIEYAEMQLLAEVYDLLKVHNGLNISEISDILESWNSGSQSSYLLEITIDILRKKEGDDYLLHKILDVASNKGTGSWTTSTAAKLGVAVPNLTAALNARYISSDKPTRLRLSKVLPMNGRSTVNIDNLRGAYECVRLCNHIQGFDLIQKASEYYGWDVDRSALARIWMNGCIIRSTLMENISVIPSEEDLIDALRDKINTSFIHLQEVVRSIVGGYVAAPCHLSSLSYVQSIRRVHSSANLIQAQRDYFGAHTYKRVDDESGQSYHTDWIA